MPKILVIEENMLLRNMIARLLCHEHEVIGAEDSGRGLVLLQRENPALVVADIGVPERSGFLTIQQIRALSPGATILAILSGARVGRADRSRMAASLGVSELIEKPFAPGELIAAVTRCLASGENSPPAADHYAGGSR